MKINLKKFVQDKEALKAVQSEISGPLGRKLNKIISFYEEVELDLEVLGESKIELDKDRMEAIEERNKMLAFMKNADDI